MKIGDKLKHLRTTQHLTQQDLAKELNMSATSIHNIETNSVSPTMETLLSVVRYFNVSLDWLAGIKPQVADLRHCVRYLVTCESCVTFSDSEWSELLRAFLELDCLVIQSGFAAESSEYLEKAIMDSDYYVFLTEGDESKILVPQSIERHLSLANHARIPCLVLVRDSVLSEDLADAKSTRAVRNIAKVRHVHGSMLTDVLTSGMVSLRQKTSDAVAGWLPMADKMRSDSIYEERLETLKKLMDRLSAKNG